MAAVAQNPTSERLVRLSRIVVDPARLEEYLSFVSEVGRESVEREEGVITLFSVAEKERPNHITILEIYANREAYEKHLQTPWFQRYKQGTLDMVQELQLIDCTALVPDMKIK